MENTEITPAAQRMHTAVAALRDAMINAGIGGVTTVALIEEVLTADRLCTEADRQ